MEKNPKKIMKKINGFDMGNFFDPMSNSLKFF